MVSYLRQLSTKVMVLCLNPYCSGQWSRTPLTIVFMSLNSLVLILIVVDNGLVLDLIRHY